MIRTGKIAAAHGVSGDVIMTNITGSKGWLKVGDAVFIAIRRESYIPHFVAAVKSIREDEFTVHLEETDSVEAARKLVGKEVFVEEGVLEKGGADSPLLWIGFELIDESAGALGPIEDIYQTASQWLASVRYKGKEVLAPLIEQTLLKVDLKGRKILVELPEGLLDIYA